jgi:hypothetical protein
LIGTANPLSARSTAGRTKHLSADTSSLNVTLGSGDAMVEWRYFDLEARLYGGLISPENGKIKVPQALVLALTQIQILFAVVIFCNPLFINYL